MCPQFEGPNLPYRRGAENALCNTATEVLSGAGAKKIKQDFWIYLDGGRGKKIKQDFCGRRLISQEATERFYSLLAVLRALQGERMRRIGVLALFASDGNELAHSSLSFWTFSLVSRPMPSPDQSDDGPNGTPE